MLDAGREVGYWILDAGCWSCECGARSRIMVTASTEREVGYWMLDAECWSLRVRSAKQDANY